MLERYCGSCHISSYDTALPDALAVFDLTEVDWARNLTPENDPGIFDRLESGMGAAGAAQPAEIAVVRRYLDTLYVPLR